jgi:glycine/D-amino acid oxidase-like deaminating enzyme
MRDNIKRGVNLQTKTRALNVVGATGKWVVKTERGDIECSEVVHATNAYSSALEPSLRGLITPCPHMCNRVIPPKASKDSVVLKNSYGVLLPYDGLFSINPRINGDGAVLFGGTNPGQDEFMKWLEKNPHRHTDDGLTGFPSVTKAVHDFAVAELKAWPTEEEAYKNAWSGILGLVGGSLDVKILKYGLMYHTRLKTDCRL